MKRKQLFPQIGGFIHGGDYNPEQWLDRPDILEQDIKLMKEAGVNCATLGVFSWSVYEPTEGNYNFDWLENIMDNLYAHGIFTILATPSGARPYWLDEKYPDAMRCDDKGVRVHHGVRHNHCMTSVNYRKKVAAIDSQLAKRFANHKGLLMWHISNELGGYCYCPSCRKAFQDYLRDKYDNDIENLNKAWWTTFWSHKYNSFDQIDPPYSDGESCVMGLNLDWKRFNTFSATDFMKFEIDTLHQVRADIPTTTNYMDMFYDYDYHYMTQFIDYISWDNYPALHNDYESVFDTFMQRGFNHALFRSLKPGQPFMLMESAPGVVNWHPVNKYHRPGFHKLVSLQAVAGGSDTVQYFQWRKSRGSSEQFHGAVVDHIGTDDTRVFKEVAELGEILKKLSPVTGSVSQNKAALLFDWDNRWAIDDARTLSQESKNYDKTCMDFWTALMHLDVECDIISQDMDFSKYKLIIAPMMYLLHDGIGEKVKSFVADGGQFLATYFTGYVNKSTLTWLGGFPGDNLSEVFGLKSEEIDALYPRDRNLIKINDSTKTVEVFEYQELLREVSADVLATYEGDYVAGSPAICDNKFGKGHAYYVACRTNADDLRFLLELMLDRTDIDYKLLPDELEHHVRFYDDKRFDFYFNLGKSDYNLNIKGTDLITGNSINGEYTLFSYDCLVTSSTI